MGFYSDSMGYEWDFIVIQWDMNGFYSDSMGYEWDFIVIQWDMNGIL